MRSTQIRDEMASSIESMWRFVKVAKTHMPTFQPTDLPLVQVFVMAETLEPDGDENVGVPAFKASAIIAASVVRGFDDPSALDGSIDADCDAIEAALLESPTFVRLGKDALFEGVSRIQRRRMFPKDGETYFAELRLEFTFDYRVQFEPRVDDDYTGADVTVRAQGASPDAPYTKFKIDPPQD